MSSEAGDQGIDLALGYAVGLCEYGDCIGDLLAAGDHIGEVNEKVDVVGIVEADTGATDAKYELTVEIKDVKYCHVGIAHDIFI